MCHGECVAGVSADRCPDARGHDKHGGVTWRREQGKEGEREGRRGRRVIRMAYRSGNDTKKA